MSFCLGVCSQLPKGVAPSLLERLLGGTLTPLLQHLYRNPEEKLVLSLSGCEMEWLEASHPEINVLINSLARRGQIEFLTSSYNALRLRLLPSGDRASEIEKTSAFIRRRYSKRAEGLWVADQLWSPSFIPLMNLCSLGYVVISASPQAGPRARRAPFLMDEKGKSALVVPTNDEISRIVREGSLARKDAAALASDLARTRIDRNAMIDLAMINADQLLYEGADGFALAMAVVQRYKEKGLRTSAVDHKALLRSEVLDFGYLPEGVYGCGAPAPPAAPDETVLEDVFKRSSFKFFEKLRLQAKLLPLDKNIKKEIGQLLVKCLGRCPFREEADLRLPSKTFFELRAILESKRLGIPDRLDFDNDGFDELLLQNDDLALLIDGKGGAPAAVFCRSEGWEILENPPALPLFSDVISTSSGKILRLGKRRYALEGAESDRRQVVARLDGLTQEGLSLAIEKTFFLEGGSINVAVKVQNRSSKSASFKYSLALPLAGDARAEVARTDGAKAENPRANGARGEAVKSITARGETAKAIGARGDGAKANGARAEAARAAGAAGADGPALSLRFKGGGGELVCEGTGPRFRAVADTSEFPYTGYRIQWDLWMKPNSGFKAALTFKTGDGDGSSEQKLP